MGRLNLRPEMLKLKSWHHMKIGEERCFCQRQNKQRNAGDDIETERQRTASNDDATFR